MISPEIIKFASDISNYGIKQNSKISAIVKNKICGDKITIELKITNKTEIFRQLKVLLVYQCTFVSAL